MPTIQTGAGNVTTFAALTGTTVTVAKPSNVADGDVLFAAIQFQNGTATITPPSGWTQIGQENTNWTWGLFYKTIPTASAESATNYVWTTSSTSGRCEGMIARVTGASASTPLDASGTFAVHTGTASVVLSGISPVSSAALLIAATFSQTATTGAGGAVPQPPSPMTAAGSAVNDNGTNRTDLLWFGQEQLSAAGATGNRTIPLSPTGTASAGILVAFRGAHANPTATVTADQNVTAGAAVSATVTPTLFDGATATYAWTVLSSRSSTSPSLTNSTTANVGLTAPAVDNIVTLQCVVTDSLGGSVTVTTEVRVSVAAGTTLTPKDITGFTSSSGTWTLAGGAGTVPSALADATDTTYAESGTVSGTGQVHRERLSPSAVKSTAQIVERLSTDGNGTANVAVRLYKGGDGSLGSGTLLQTWTQTLPNSTTFTDYTFTLSSPTLASITTNDWNNLSREVEVTS